MPVLESFDLQENKVGSEKVLDLSHNPRSGSACSAMCHKGSDSHAKFALSTHLISNALTALSLEERDRLYCDIHGVATYANELEARETPQFILEHLNKMELELCRLKYSRSEGIPLEAFELADQTNPAFVRDPHFRASFLRAREWDVTKAAVSFIRHFDLRRMLFGDAKLTKEIELEDLDPEDVKMLRKGYMQRLPARDSAGRLIYCFMNVGQEYSSAESLVRQLFYLCSDDAEDVQRGYVQINFRIKPYTFRSGNIANAFAMMYRCATDMPARWAAMHSCLESPSSMMMVVEAATRLFSQEHRARSRLHYGSYIDWCYTLLTFGIPLDLLPLTSDFKVKTKNHLDYIAMREKAVEMKRQSKCPVPAIFLPTNRDILLGKGRPIQQSIGNQQLSALLDGMLDEYSNKTRAGKTAFAKQIVEHVKANKGRFLSKESGVWLVVSDTMAREKIINMIRHQRKKDI